MIARILNAQGILSSDVPTGNLLWVDAVNGIDELAARGRMTVPFKTLTKAKEKAVSGDTIMVLPGVYDERNLLKNGVNWYFLPGARVEYDGSYAIFDDGASGANGAVECLIGGYGDFATQAILYTTNANSKIHLVCARIFGNDQCIVCEEGSQFVEVHGDFQGWVTAYDGSLNLRSRRLIEVYCVVDGGTHWIRAQEGSPAAAFLSGGSLYWEVPRTVGFPVEPVFFLAGGVLRVINSVVMAGEDICSPGHGIEFQGGKCILKDSHVIDNGNNEALYGDGDLVCLGRASSNKGKGTNVILLTVGSSFNASDTGVEF